MARQKIGNAANLNSQARQSETKQRFMPQIRIGDTGWINSRVQPYESESQAEAIAKGFAKGWLGVAEWRSARVGADLNDPGETPIVESDWDEIDEREAHHELVESRAESLS